MSMFTLRFFFHYCHQPLTTAAVDIQFVEYTCSFVLVSQPIKLSSIIWLRSSAIYQDNNSENNGLKTDMNILNSVPK